MEDKKQDSEEAEIPTDRDVAVKTADLLKNIVTAKVEVIENILKDINKNVDEGIDVILHYIK